METTRTKTWSTLVGITLILLSVFLNTSVDCGTTRGNLNIEMPECPPEPRITILGRLENNPGEEPILKIIAEFNTSGQSVARTAYAPLMRGIISVECKSNQPVTWDFQGYLDQQVLRNAVLKRDVMMHLNTTEFCFKALLHINTSAEATFNWSQYYTCAHVTSGENSTKASIFLFGRSDLPPKFVPPANTNDSESGSCATAIASTPSLEVTIPCRSSHPNVSVELTKQSTDQQQGSYYKLNQTRLNMIYDAKVGFTLTRKNDAASNSSTFLKSADLYGRYKCTILNTGTDHYRHDGHHNSGERNPTHGTSLDSLEVLVCPPIEKLLKTQPERSTELKIKLKPETNQDGDYEHFTCTPTLVDSSSDDPKISMSLIKCSNPLHCQLLTKFLQTFPSKVKSLSVIERKTNSLLVPADYGGGVVICRMRDKHKYQYVQFYRRIDPSNNEIIVYHDSPQEDPKISQTPEPVINASSVIHINVRPLIKVDGYESASMNISCSASTFVFARGLQWFLQYSDGSTISPNIMGLRERYFINLETMNEAILSDKTDNLTNIICRAPVWNSTEWIDLSFSIEKPKIINASENELNFYDSDIHKAIFCEAKGSPEPTITWYKDGKVVDRLADLHYQKDGNRVKSTLVFFKPAKLNGSTIDGRYTCKPSNFFGEAYYTVDIKVIPYSSLHFWFPSIGGFFLISTTILLAFLIRYVIKSKRNKLLMEKFKKQFYNGMDPSKIHELLETQERCAHTGDGFLDAARAEYDQKHEIPPEDVFIDKPPKVLGIGTYGRVVEAYLNVPEAFGRTPVAVKLFKQLSEQTVADIMAELKLIIHANQGRHTNIVGFVGAITIVEPIRIVLEYCPKGSLEKYLRKHADTFVNELTDPPPVHFNPEPMAPYVQAYYSQQVTTTHLINWCLQLARGMEYLESIRLIHGDLATRNLLLTEELVLKIADFGLSKPGDASNRYIPSKDSTYGIRRKPLEWLALEYLLDDTKLSTKTDVWAYGVTLWEIFSLCESYPYAGFEQSFPYFTRELSAGYRLPRPAYASQEIYNVMLRCWKENLADRPTFSELADFFELLRNPVVRNIDENLNLNEVAQQLPPSPFVGRQPLPAEPEPAPVDASDGYVKLAAGLLPAQLPAFHLNDGYILPGVLPLETVAADAPLQTKDGYVVPPSGLAPAPAQLLTPASDRYIPRGDPPLEEVVAEAPAPAMFQINDGYVVQLGPGLGQSASRPVVLTTEGYVKLEQLRDHRE